MTAAVPVLSMHVPRHPWTAPPAASCVHQEYGKALPPCITLCSCTRSGRYLCKLRGAGQQRLAHIADGHNLLQRDYATSARWPRLH